MKKFLFILVVLVLATIACGGTGKTPSDPNLILKDDFTSNTRKWDEGDSDDGSDVAIRDGKYTFTVKGTNWDYWAIPNNFKITSDVVIEVDAELVSGPKDVIYGVICGYNEDTHEDFHVASIAEDGYAIIYKYVAGEIEILYDELDAFEDFKSPNRLQVSCIGNTITLVVNGVQIATAESDSLVPGNIGFLTGTYDETDAVVTFDNLEVRKPAQ